MSPEPPCATWRLPLHRGQHVPAIQTLFVFLRAPATLRVKHDAVGKSVFVPIGVAAKYKRPNQPAVTALPGAVAECMAEGDVTTVGAGFLVHVSYPDVTPAAVVTGEPSNTGSAGEAVPGPRPTAPMGDNADVHGEVEEFGVPVLHLELAQQHPYHFC